MPQQIDMVCTNCPLGTCDEDSLWCAFRWATEPNAAQLMLKAEALKVQKPTWSERQAEYGPLYRAIHREKKRAYDRERYQARKQAEVQGTI